MIKVQTTAGLGGACIDAASHAAYIAAVHIWASECIFNLMYSTNNSQRLLGR